MNTSTGNCDKTHKDYKLQNQLDASLDESHYNGRPFTKRFSLFSVYNYFYYYPSFYTQTHTYACVYSKGTRTSNAS